MCRSSKISVQCLLLALLIKTQSAANCILQNNFWTCKTNQHIFIASQTYLPFWRISVWALQQKNNAPKTSVNTTLSNPHLIAYLSHCYIFLLIRYNYPQLLSNYKVYPAQLVKMHSAFIMLIRFSCYIRKNLQIFLLLTPLR